MAVGYVLFSMRKGMSFSRHQAVIQGISSTDVVTKSGRVSLLRHELSSRLSVRRSLLKVSVSKFTGMARP